MGSAKISIEFTGTDGSYDTTIDVTVIDSFTPPPPSDHTITASAGTGGSINPSGGVPVSDGGSQTFTITPDIDYRIKDVLVDNASVGVRSSHSFDNVTDDHTIHATFEYTGGGQPQTYTITFNANGGTVSTATMQTGVDGKLASLPTPTRSGSYSFDGWFTSASNGTQITTNTEFTDNSTVYAHWTYTGGSGGGGGNGGGSSTPPSSNITTEKKSEQPTTAKQDITATVDKNGVATVTITEAMVKALIDAAKKDAAANGKTADGIGVQLNVLFGANGKSAGVQLTEAALALLEKEGVKRFDINTPLVNFSLDYTAIKELGVQTSGNITFSATPVAKLSDAAKKLIGSRPVFGITVSYQKNGKRSYVTNFNKGTIALGIAYTPSGTEKTGNLYGVYVDKNGKPQLLTNSSLDGKRIIFGRNSLSTYGVGYKTPAPAFIDITNHWAKDNIDFVASRNLISGATSTTFAPETAITRGTFLMALGKLSGADVSGYKTSNFTDVKSTDPAMPYIEWAVKYSIVQGIGNNKFGPDQQITREQMAVMMVNYAKATGYKLPVSRQAVTFADNAKISAYAKDAVKAIQQAGIINGKGNNVFDPQGNATRAEASTILRKFIELVIDEGTARGWSQNDSGQWQYINTNGMAITGWLTAGDNKYYFDDKAVMVYGKWLQIDGKWYYFGADGRLATNTTVDGYEVGGDGVRKEK